MDSTLTLSLLISFAVGFNYLTHSSDEDLSQVFGNQNLRQPRDFLYRSYFGAQFGQHRGFYY